MYQDQKVSIILSASPEKDMFCEWIGAIPLSRTAWCRRFAMMALLPFVAFSVWFDCGDREKIAVAPKEHRGKAKVLPVESTSETEHFGQAGIAL